MKDLFTGQVTDSARMPIKSGSLQFIQEAYREVFKAIGDYLTDGDPTKAYIIQGVYVDLLSGTWSVTAGWVYCNGAFFRVDPVSFVDVVGQVPVLHIEEDPTLAANQDPVTFTDGVNRNVHLDATVKFKMAVAGGSGVSGYVADYANVLRIPPPNRTIETGVPFPTTFTAQFDRNYNLFFSGTASGLNDIQFDLRYVAPGASTRIEATFAAGASLVFTLGGQPINIRAEGGTGITIPGGGGLKVIYLTYQGYNGSNHIITSTAYNL
ncbi:MAG: hypothetical protein EOP56_09395 [Sphingobacteriales bacterium]|nr:MAG: hypothetical protein EOP56_09395 [Sphingobacteriales bacterium]